MRYYIKCKLNPPERQQLIEDIESGSLAKGNIFYEGMQTALREGTLDENDIVHFVEICIVWKVVYILWLWRFQP
jgi:hypothetical protein